MDTPDKPGWWWFRGTLRHNVTRRRVDVDRPCHVAAKKYKRDKPPFIVAIFDDVYEASEFDGKWWHIEPPAEPAP